MLCFPPVANSSQDVRCETWICRVCGLIQADPEGLFCEFCSVQREIDEQPGPASRSYFQKIDSMEAFVAAWTGQEQKHKGKAAEHGGQAELGKENRSGKEARAYLAGADTKKSMELARETGGWYIVVKITYQDKKLGEYWETLRTGWHWLVQATRTALRTRLTSNRKQIHDRDDICLPVLESFQKVVNKLTRRDWLLLYECMKTEFSLEAEAMARGKS